MKINKSKIAHYKKTDCGMLKIFLKLDDLIWIDFMYPAELDLYFLTKPKYIKVLSVQES